MSNKQIGNAFEAEFCEILAKHGFWAHNFANRAEGQPADVIAVKNYMAFIIDCKTCEKDFRLSRVEENQEQAMLRWISCGNAGAYFAIKLLQTQEIFMVSFAQIQDMKRRGVRTLKRKDLISYATLETWLEWRK